MRNTSFIQDATDWLGETAPISNFSKIMIAASGIGLIASVIKSKIENNKLKDEIDELECELNEYDLANLFDESDSDEPCDCECNSCDRDKDECDYHNSKLDNIKIGIANIKNKCADPIKSGIDNADICEFSTPVMYTAVKNSKPLKFKL